MRMRWPFLVVSLAILTMAGAAAFMVDLAPGKFVIRKGGTYSGNWASFDADVPAVVIKTSEPVIIENSIVQGRGILIVGATKHVDITIRNTRGVAVEPNIKGRSPGRFVSLEQFKNVVIENCSL